MNHTNPSREHTSRLSTPVRLCVAAVAACFISSPVLSNPVTPTVVNGTATFNQVGNVLTVTNSNGAIINWDKFSIQAGETTHFAQTAASSAVLNRVLNDPSAIYGTLSSNGRVWLINPAGILVGAGGRVDTAGFVASTLAIRNEDFLAGRKLFTNDGNAKNVEIEKSALITTPAGGSVYLIGSNVSNEGIITTPAGETILAAGATVSLIDSATPGVKVDITGAAGNSTNLGTIAAEAGRIGIAGVIVRNLGTLNASSVVSEGGRIFLKASQEAYVDGNGRIVTTGIRGGSVEVLGNRVEVTDKAEIDASGVNGGGRILVGGDFQGKNPEIQNASDTIFGPGAKLKADATEVGAGGTVIVWADNSTRAYGNISARGGARGGDGGFVETSGHRALSVSGARVDTRAPNGTSGSWLLDPTNIRIEAGAYGGPLGGMVSPIVSSVITDADVNAALVSSNLIIQTSGGSGGVGNITADGVTISSGGLNSLTLAAYGGGSSSGNISIINNSSVFVNGGVTMLAGWDGTGFTSSNVISGRGDISISGSTIQSGSAAINLWAGQDILLGRDPLLPISDNKGTWVQGNGMDVRAGRDLRLTGGSGNIGSYGAGVMLGSMSTQAVSAGRDILLIAGNASNASYGGNSMYGGSVAIQASGNQYISATSIKLAAGTAGHDNAAQILDEGSYQEITVTSLLDLKGGGGGNNNDASIGASGGFGVQRINATGASIVLTGGASGGAPGQENSADIGLGDNNTFGSRTVYAGSIAINGGGNATTYGGAGFGTHHGQTQSFYITSDLIMTGGASSASDFRATSAYIGSEYGGGTIDVRVGGNIILNGGADTAGGVLVGSLIGDTCGGGCSGATAVRLSAGNSITATGNYGGVWLGVKDLSYSLGSSVTLKAGWNASGGNRSGYGGDIILAGPAFIRTDATSGSIDVTSHESDAGALGNVSLGAATSSYGSSITIAGAGDVEVAGSLIASSSMDLAAGMNELGNGPSSRGGNLNLIGTSATALESGGRVDILAQAGTSAPYGGGNITQFGGSSIHSADGNITIVGHGDVALNGSVTSSTGEIRVAAGLLGSGEGGYASLNGGSLSFGSSSNIQAATGILLESSKDITINGTMASTTGDITIAAGGFWGGYGYAPGAYSSLFGGNVTIGGNIRAYGGSVNISTNVGYDSHGQGGVTQTSGSSITGNNNVSIVAGGTASLSGTVTATTGSLTVQAGYQTGNFGYDGSYSSGRTPNGGNIVVGGTLVGHSGVDLSAESGFSSGLNGNITQLGGSIATVIGDLTIIAGRNVDLGGSVNAYGGSGSIRSGISPSMNMASGVGGDVILRSGSFLYGDQDGGDGAVVIRSAAGSGSNGNVRQYGGTIYSADGRDITIVSAGDTTLNGTVSSGHQIGIGAGMDPFNSGSSSGIGGDVSFGASSLVEARNSVGGAAIAVIAGGGSRSNTGNILQASGAHLLAGGSGDIDVVAYGDARMDGTTTISAAGGHGIFVAAGIDTGKGLDSLYTDTMRGNTGNIVTIGQFNALGGEVGVRASGAILQSISNLAGPNIMADSVDLTSYYGGPSGGLAISSVVAAASSITAKVDYGAGYGGIAIGVTGDSPAMLDLQDHATSENSISFSATQDININGNQTFRADHAGPILLSADRDVNWTSDFYSDPALDTAGEASVVAKRDINLSTTLQGGGSLLNLTAGRDLNNWWGSISSYWLDIILIGATTVDNRGSVYAGNDLDVLAGTLKNHYGGALNANHDLTMIAGNINGDGAEGGSRFYAGNNVTGVVKSDLTLVNGAYFDAGNDVILTLKGVTSTLSTLTGGYVLARTPDTIHIDFKGRSSGGLVNDGSPGSGLFVMIDGVSTPATEGNGLVLAHVSPVTDNSSSNNSTLTTDLGKATGNAATDKAPTDGDALSPLDTTKTDPNKPPADAGKTAGGTEDHFGGEEGGKDEKKDEKKDDKDKKSDLAKDEKKDEKPAQKKVAQCGM